MSNNDEAKQIIIQLQNQVNDLSLRLDQQSSMSMWRFSVEMNIGYSKKLLELFTYAKNAKDARENLRRDLTNNSMYEVIFPYVDTSIWDAMNPSNDTTFKAYDFDAKTYFTHQSLLEAVSGGWIEQIKCSHSVFIASLDG